MNTVATDITFYYSIEDIFNKVKNRTLQRVRGLKDGSGRPLFDTLALTESDRPTFNTIAPKAAVKVFNLIQPMAIGVTDAYQYNVDEPDGNGQNYIVLTITPPTNWDPNNTDPLDVYLENALVLFIVREWFRIVGAPEFAFEYNDEYNENASELNALVQKRTKAVVRPYRII